MIADIILILVMVLCIFLGYKKGLIKVAVRIIGFVAAILIALVFYTPVSNYIINNTDLTDNLSKTIESTIYNKEESNEITQEEAGIPETVEKYIENYTEEMKESSSAYIARGVAVSAIRIRYMDRAIYSSKSTYDIYKNICKYNRKYTNNKTI